MTAIYMDFSDDELNAIKVLAKVNRTSPEQVVIDTCRGAFRELFENPLEYILNHIDESPAVMPVSQPPVQEQPVEPVQPIQPAPVANSCRGTTYSSITFEKNQDKIREWLSGKGSTLDAVLNKLIAEEGVTQNSAQYRASKANLRYWLLKMSKEQPITHVSKSHEWIWKTPAPAPKVDQAEQVPLTQPQPKVAPPIKQDKAKEPAQSRLTVQMLDDDTECRRRLWAYLFKMDQDDCLNLDKVTGLYPEFQKKSVETALDDLLTLFSKRGLVKYNSFKDEWKFTSRGKFWINSMRKNNDKA